MKKLILLILGFLLFSAQADAVIRQCTRTGFSDNVARDILTINAPLGALDGGMITYCSEVVSGTGQQQILCTSRAFTVRNRSNTITGNLATESSASSQLETGTLTHTLSVTTPANTFTLNATIDTSLSSPTISFSIMIFTPDNNELAVQCVQP